MGESETKIIKTVIGTNNKLHIHDNGEEKDIISEIRSWGQCHGDLHQQEPNLAFRYKTDHLASATVPDLQIRMKKQISDL